MANQPPPEGIADDFFEQIFSMPPSYAAAPTAAAGDSSSAGGSFPLGLSLEQGSSSYGKRLRDDPSGKAEGDTFPSASLFPPGLGHIQSHPIRPNPPSQLIAQMTKDDEEFRSLVWNEDNILIEQLFHCQTKQGGIAAIPQSPAPRPKVRARRGQATDPHSIAERLRRERIAERIRELQQLVPNTNKTDRAVMLDEVLDYVKFLSLQVKVLSMSRLGGAGAVAHLIADIPLPVEGEAGKSKQQVWEKWSTDGTEREVAKLMEEDISAAMQFLQSKALCMMPISLAMAMYDTHPPESQSLKPEPNTPS